jgi:hypothetical protein
MDLVIRLGTEIPNIKKLKIKTTIIFYKIHWQQILLRKVRDVVILEAQKGVYTNFKIITFWCGMESVCWYMAQKGAGAG